MDPAISKLVDFWSRRLLDLPGYEDNPVGGHQPVLDRCWFGGAGLDRWLELWQETVEELLVGPIADLAVERAHLAAGAIAALDRRSQPV